MVEAEGSSISLGPSVCTGPLLSACLHRLPGGFCSTFILVVHPKSRQKVRKVIAEESS